MSEEEESEEVEETTTTANTAPYPRPLGGMQSRLFPVRVQQFVDEYGKKKRQLESEGARPDLKFWKLLDKG